MRYTLSLSVVLGALLLGACGATPTATAPAVPTAVAAATVGTISIIDPWARATAMGGAASATAESGMGDMASATAESGMGGMDSMKMGATYMQLANSGEADTLLSVKGDIAQTIELHTVIDENGVMQMRPVEGGIEVPANGSVELKPGSYHVMMIGLSHDLLAGQTFSLELTFEKAGTVSIEVPVRER